jgi:beta-glucosidase
VNLADLIGKLSLEQKVRLLAGADLWSLYPEPALGLRRLVVSDGPAGVRGETWDERDPSANIPSPTALAATWDTDRVAAIGRLLAYEARRKGVDVLLAPTVNLHRTPYGGRHFECLSEDPLLTARIGVAYVSGLQSCGVGACVKHFVCNDSETQRMTVDVRVDERTLRELYLVPFEAIVREAGVWSVMAAYNGVNGSTMTESPLLRRILHDEWGFDGVVMSDWTATRSTAEAARAALDLAMPGPAEMFGFWGDALVAAVRAGQVDEALIDDKVERIVRLASRVGALHFPRGDDPPGDPPARQGPPPPDTPWELRAAAAASFVLARNTGVLPLSKPGAGRIAVIGTNAAVARTMGGGSATVFPPYTTSPLDGLRAAGLDVGYAAGVYPHDRVPEAGPPWLVRPDGSGSGAEIRFFSPSGELIGTELRRRASFIWMNGFGSGRPPGSVVRVEVHAAITATSAGVYRIGVSGLGRYRMLLRGAEAFDVMLGLAEGADIGEVLMAPPQHTVPVSLAEGESVPVLVEYDVTSSPLGAFGTFLQLNVAEPHGDDDEEIGAAVALAASSDVAVVVVGTSAQTESEGFDRKTLALPGRQDDLVRAVVAANPRTVVVVNSGAPVLLPWAGDAAAVLLSWFGGQEYGNALADVLLGDAEPGGRLPTTWPASEAGLPSVRPEEAPGAEHPVLRYDEGLFIGYRAYDRDGRLPLFPFGYGLGYTSWSYESIEAEGRVADGTGPEQVTVRVTIRNSGTRRGREVVQVYASRPDSAIERPVKWLAGFAVADADPGEPVTVTIRVPERVFQHWTEQGWAVEPGTFTLAAGPSSATLPLSRAIGD